MNITLSPTFPVVQQHTLEGARGSQAYEPVILSIHQLMNRIGLTQNSPHPINRARRLLNKVHLINIFSESDRVHLLQIFCNFNVPFTESEAKGLIEWFKIVKEELGDEIFSYVTNPFCYVNSCHAETMKLLQYLIELSHCIDDIKPFLIQFYLNQGLKDLLGRIVCIKSRIELQKYPEKDLDEVINAFRSLEEGSLVAFPLSEDQLVQIKEEYLQIAAMKDELKEGGIDSLTAFVRDFKIKAKAGTITADDKLKLIAVGREAIRIKFGIFPYNTQIIVVLGLLRYPESLRGRIAQARTGEGKSTIVALLSFYHACQGLPVDVMSTSRYLARRDQEKYAGFFDLFAIATSHLCTDEPTEENFSGLIIYGTNHDFEFAWMRDMLGHERIRRIVQDGLAIPRPLQIVIVDEVDSLFIDSALNSARISIEGRSELNWIYRPILDFVSTNKELVSMSFGHSNFGNASIKRKFQNEILESLRGCLCSYQEGQFKAIVEKLKAKKIETWIRSAFSALFDYELLKDYVIKPVEVRTPEGSVYQDQIVIVDRKNTGRLQEGCRWEGGLHEFVEVKEGLQIRNEGLMPASICHPIYFRNYQKVFGVTGTMGSTGDRNEIQEIHQVDTFDAPPHKKSVRERLETKILYSRSDYFESLSEEARLMQTLQRPILFVVETIQDTLELHDFLKCRHIFSRVLNERQVQQEDFIIAKAGAPGSVTIATNTAGRGTDIILHPSSLANGGLHMVFGFFPENERVKMQGFGRAGRQGQPGSCRMILQFDDSSLPPIEAYAFLKMKRDRQINSLALVRMERFAIEQINHEYLKIFFDQNQSWNHVVSDDFLGKACSVLMGRLKEIRPSFIGVTSSPSIDRKIALLQKAFIYQASRGALFEDSWVPFLKCVRSSLKKHIQQEWAEFFYSELDELYREVKMLDSPESKLEDRYRKLIEESYLLHRDTWEKYLKEPEQGFYRYLSLVTGILDLI